MKLSCAHVVDEAIHDVVKAYKTCVSQVKLGLIKRFRLRYKKASSSIETICIPSEYFSKKHNSFMVRKLGNAIKSTIPIEGFSTTCRLSWNKNKKQFILFMPVDRKKYTVKNRDKICSLDPGLRTFQTLYSKKSVHEFGAGISKKLSRQLDRIERAKKQVTDEKTTPRKYKKFSTRIYSKIKNYVKDFHWKTALKLVKSYDTILVGNMSTKGICRGNLNKSSKRVAIMLSHYKFNTRLIEKAEQYDAKVIIVDESYTSKTCGGCFEKNYDLGASKFFKCNDCEFNWDRDFNGARNIMLRYYNVI
jgi:IS605 OrfB family transposase